MGIEEGVSVNAGSKVRPPVSMLYPRFSKLPLTFEIAAACYGCPWSLCLRSQSLSTLPLVSYAKTMLDISLPGLTHPPNFGPQELQQFLLVVTGLGNQGCPVGPCVCLASPLSRVQTCEGGSSQSSRQQEEQRVLPFQTLSWGTY